MANVAQENLELVRDGIKAYSEPSNATDRAVLAFLITAEKYMAAGIRWGLIEETAMALSKAQWPEEYGLKEDGDML